MIRSPRTDIGITLRRILSSSSCHGRFVYLGASPLILLSLSRFVSRWSGEGVATLERRLAEQPVGLCRSASYAVFATTKPLTVTFRTTGRPAQRFMRATSRAKLVTYGR